MTTVCSALSLRSFCTYLLVCAKGILLRKDQSFACIEQIHHLSADNDSLINGSNHKVPKARTCRRNQVLQCLAGKHPVAIQRLQVFPPSSTLDSHMYGESISTITARHLKPSLQGLSIEEAINQNLLYILDHHDSLLPFIRLQDAEPKWRACSSKECRQQCAIVCVTPQTRRMFCSSDQASSDLCRSISSFDTVLFFQPCLVWQQSRIRHWSLYSLDFPKKLSCWASGTQDSREPSILFVVDFIIFASHNRDILLYKFGGLNRSPLCCKK